MNIGETRDEIKRRWRELWPHDEGKGENQGVVCPLCQNGSGADGDGVKQDRRRDGYFLHCFKCGFNGDAITLLRRETGKGYMDAIEEGARRLSLSYERSYPRAAALKPPAQTSGNRARNVEKPSTDINYHAAEEKPPKMNFSPFIESARAGLDNPAAVEYLTGRGISIETAAAYRLGYAAEWVNPATGRKQSGGRLIVPFASDCGYLARSIGGDEKGAKQNGGAVGLFGDVEALQGAGVVFVTEGWADALSIVEAGKENGTEYHAVALNGAANGRKLIEAAADFSGVFVLALDNDEAGRKAAENLSAMIQEAGFPFSVADLCGGCKDENEFLVMDRAGFSFACLEAYETAQAAAEKAARPDSIDAYITGGGWREDVERGAENREKTGFPALDNWLGGGLYEGLTVISGFPSLGKTSLLWQIAENVAAGGCHVLFFALEMSRADMLAKSLSRRAFKRGRDVTSDDAQSGRDACREELRELLQDVGARLEIVEGSFGYGVETIRQRTKRHKGGRLAVFVDYLQAAADYKGGGSEFAAISDTAKAFRQMARELHCPIICASSTARGGYNAAVGYDSFYGSSGIEYAADCAAGLQLSAVYSKEYRDAGKERTGGKEKQAAIIERAKKETPRRVSLVGLKNRRGAMSGRIDFLFDVRHCAFTESIGVEDETLSARDVEDLLQF